MDLQRGTTAAAELGRNRHVHQLKSLCPNFHRGALNFCALQLCVRGLKGLNPVFRYVSLCISGEHYQVINGVFSKRSTQFLMQMARKLII